MKMKDSLASLKIVCLFQNDYRQKNHKFHLACRIEAGAEFFSHGHFCFSQGKAMSLGLYHKFVFELSSISLPQAFSVGFLSLQNYQ